MSVLIVNEKKSNRYRKSRKFYILVLAEICKHLHAWFSMVLGASISRAFQTPTCDN